MCVPQSGSVCGSPVVYVRSVRVYSGRTTTLTDDHDVSLIAIFNGSIRVVCSAAVTPCVFKLNVESSQRFLVAHPANM